MRLVMAFVVLLVGFAVLPGFVAILNSLQDTISALEGASNFEIYLWALVPWLLFIAVPVYAIYTLIGRKGPPGGGQ